ncbi:MAG: NAD-dependent epimerase [Geminicoccaceae bacterium]|nr:NAD-dependent epimerase [Geminicoccaceae bacterium]
MPLLVTGAAGFIGNALALRLLDEGQDVVGVDSVNDYYDVRLKRARLARLEGRPGWRFVEMDLADRAGTADLFAELRPAVVVHLAAQAGVRYSLENPHAYVDANLVAFVNVLEGCRHGGCRHLVYASSSSVYGGNTRMPFSTADGVDHPVSLYAATKKANELMAHAYSHLYALPTTGLRFFTVYGPWMRPDMVPFVFAELMTAGRPIRVFNEGRMRRDFTYIDDIVEGVRRAIDHPPSGDPAWSGDSPSPGTSFAPYRVFNIGNNRPEDLMHVIGTLEAALGVEARKDLLPMQPGDVPATYADTDDLAAVTGFRPETPIETGIERFARWYAEVWRPIKEEA